MELENVALIKEAHEAQLLKQYLRGALKSYAGISHEELRNICAMFGVCEEGEGE